MNREFFKPDEVKTLATRFACYNINTTPRKKGRGKAKKKTNPKSLPNDPYIKSI